MQVYRHLTAVKNQPFFLNQLLVENKPLALAIGNFDGMHLGHKALLHKLCEQATAKNLTPAVMTFEPHPREFFTPLNAPARLSNLREKLEYFESTGIQKVFVCAFNKRFAAISALEFLNILREKLHASTILVGEDFKFGAKRAGTIDDFKAGGFDLISMPRVDFNSERVSSTRVRDALFSGNLVLAAQLLGRNYSVNGKVVHGAKRGRALGFPTANIHMRHERPALTGVYAVKLDGLNSVANLGVRPTIAGVPKLLLEVHILDFNGDLYGRHVHVEFLHKIREEMKFDSLDALKAQIAADIVTARNFFSTVIPS
ncbi:MAG: bifunctional riboflavin kinase/FAD synthetase [Bdellovibrio sp.]|nr:bifunctional riboflavin kinase/FAD synthetase [Methylotenera sp.]